MLIKFFPHGKGSGSGPVDYVTRIEAREHAPPEVLRGDPEMTRDLIDSIDRDWRYTSGVVSFAPGDAPSAEQQRMVMDEFERTAFAGLDPDQYDVLWVRHSHTEGGRIELHFVTPRMELSSGRAFNIAPPGWESLYAPLRDALNIENGWARPDDPELARDRQITREAPERVVDREFLHTMVEGWVEDGLVRNRSEIVAELEGAGFAVPRQGEHTITVHDRESDERFRLKGAVYEQGWTAAIEIERAHGREGREREALDRGAPGRDRLDAGERQSEARRELESRLSQRAERHAELYGGRDGRDAGLRLDGEPGDRPTCQIASNRGPHFASNVAPYGRG